MLRLLGSRKPVDEIPVPTPKDIVKWGPYRVVLAQKRKVESITVTLTFALADGPITVETLVAVCNLQLATAKAKSDAEDGTWNCQFTFPSLPEPGFEKRKEAEWTIACIAQHCALTALSGVSQKYDSAHNELQCTERNATYTFNCPDTQCETLKDDIRALGFDMGWLIYDKHDRMLN